MGEGRVEEVGRDEVRLSCRFDRDPPPPLPLVLLVAAVRPIVGRRLLRDLAALGVERVVVFPARLSERSYLESTLWKGGEWERCLVEGAEQGVTTRVPEVVRVRSLEEGVGVCGEGVRYVCDEAVGEGGRVARAGRYVVAVGPERGWTEEERRVLAEEGFVRLSLGPRMLRAEVACHVAVGRVAEGAGWWG
ncbi:hypothetical protein STHERM_c16490 [Spirochaeta thermophila DSM 6192]|uniref:16S rRNA (uracil(1498)-N(3))-methyltransferase n=2 Tax=Winmispira thermophila TaxID=154 RepID=E0RNJ8_WINT6|nr:hypothetical protein STHERM_c16490 [Spirochaeta thermophila DSM 6192]